MVTGLFSHFSQIMDALVIGEVCETNVFTLFDQQDYDVMSLPRHQEQDPTCRVSIVLTTIDYDYI